MSILDRRKKEDGLYTSTCKKAKYFKQNETGVATMSRILEDMRNEKAKEIAIRMIKGGKMSLEDIADYTELSFDIIKELENQIMQLS